MLLLHALFVCVVCFTCAGGKEEEAKHDSGICDDFYRHACSRWQRATSRPASEPIWNTFTATATRITAILHDILSGTESTGLVPERTFYKSCMRSTDYEPQLRVLIDVLGGIIHADDDTSGANGYNYLAQIHQTSALLGVHPMLTIRRRGETLRIVRGEFVFPEVYLAQPHRHARELQIYMQWVEGCLAVLGIPFSGRVAAEIVDFEVQLAQLPHAPAIQVDAARLTSMLQLHLAGGEPMLMLPTVAKYNWIDAVYIAALGQFVSQSRWRFVSNYVVWWAIKELARDTNAAFRELSFQVDRALLGVEEDVPRSAECVGQTVRYVGDGGALTLAFHAHRGVDEHAVVDEVQRMAIAIQHAFLRTLRHHHQHAQRIRAIRFEIMQPARVKPFVDLRLDDNHFANVLKLKRRALEPDGVQWPENLFSVNAFYSPSQNAIRILQPPFFDLRQSRAANYGALGALIGHELSHALDGSRQGKKPNDTNGCEMGKMPLATLNEYIADYVGVGLSYDVFSAFYANDVQAEQHTEEFFLSYAKMWCEIDESDEQTITTLDEHDTARHRVNNTLNHFQPFLATFDCATPRLQDFISCL